MKKITAIHVYILLIMIFFISVVSEISFAESIFVKDGRILEGKIIKENDSTVTIVTGTTREIDRKDVLRTIYHNSYKEKKYITTADGKVYEVFIVDEDNSCYTCREKLDSNIEIKILKEDIESISKKRVVAAENVVRYAAAGNGDGNREIAGSSNDNRKEESSFVPDNGPVNGETDGFAVMAGAGVPYGMIGFQGGYYYHTSQDFTVVPYLSLSVFPLFDEENSFGFSFGSMFTYGSRHRVFLDFSILFLSDDSDYDSDNDEYIFLTSDIGYEFCANNGLVFRISVGPVYCMSEYYDEEYNDDYNEEEYVKKEDNYFAEFPVPSIAIGYKF